MNSVSIRFLVFSFATVITLSGCDRQPDPETNQAMVVTSVTNQLLLPGYESLMNEAENLANAVEQFQQDPTPAHFDDLQSQWIAAMRQWKRCQVFHFGPMKEEDLHYDIDFSPTRENLIQQALADSTPVTDAFVDKLGAAAKGFPALEYLLFDANTNHQACFDSLTIGTNAQRRREYAAALSRDIVQVTSYVDSVWENGYTDDFLNSTSGFRIELGEIANAMLYMVEIVKNDRIGSPLGKTVGNLPRPEEAEAWRSRQSLTLLRENLDMARLVYLGRQEFGFDDALISLDRGDLDAEIQAAFDQVFSRIDGISLPLSQAVQLERDQVEQLFEDLTDLVRLLKADMFSALSITITFSDADGD